MIVTVAEQTKRRESRKSYCKFARSGEKKKKTRNQLISANILALLKNNGGLKLRRREVTGLSEKEEAERSRACESERVLCFP